MVSDDTPQKRKRTSTKKSSQRDKADSLNDTTSTKGKSWTFPKATLEDALRVPKAIEEKFAGNSTPASDVAKAVGFKLVSDWRFTDLLRASNLYGLVSGTGATATVSLTPLGQDIVTPSAAAQRADGLLKAFHSVEDFRRVDEFYRGKRIPEDEFFLNTLIRQFGVPKDRVQIFAEIYKENIKYLRSFSPSRSLAGDNSLRDVGPEESSGVVTSTGPSEGHSGDARVREFLDTCFVMMPFGHWQDKYYQEIYIPAIKDASLEPVRGDELYHTGSVVEQIWEQITKSKILVADLSDRNANVFYELGLAHAAGKPVVFTASNIDDVPFDLRHLRVIVYDVREPSWATKLKQSMTEYIRNALREPAKSIPSIFRKAAEDEEDLPGAR